MKKTVYLLILLSVVFVLSGCSNDNVDNQNTNSTVDNNSSENQENTTNEKEEKSAPIPTPVEEELSSFSTKIQSKEEQRVNNISIACSTINGTVLKSGETFSFWKVLGNPTTEKGYKEAKAFTANGGVTTAIGGGLCQVSSTIYNVVLNVPELETVERHQHTREVYYVKLGKDATVSYGGADFRFKNNLPNTIKIYAECTGDNVIIRFVKLV